MNLPGARLRALAARVCSEKTMERIIDPAIGDLQEEFRQARRGGRVWRSHWALLVGYAAIARVVVLCSLRGATQAWRDWDADDRRNLRGVLWCSAVVTMAFAFLFEMPGLRLAEAVSPDARTGLLIAYLIPAALAPSTPVGFFVGIAIGLGGRSLSRRLIAGLGLVALLLSVVSLINVGWITPIGNQSYREEMFGGPLPRGQNELTFAELMAFPGGSYSYHVRLAIVAAPFTFAVFGVVAATRRWRRAALVISVGSGVVGYCTLMIIGRPLSQAGLMPPRLAAWMPLLFLAYATILIGWLVGRRTEITRRRA